MGVKGDSYCKDCPDRGKRFRYYRHTEFVCHWRPRCQPGYDHPDVFHPVFSGDILAAVRERFGHRPETEDRLRRILGRTSPEEAA